ncbi:hypothetical protein D584_11247 [Brucella intermedia M86]|uniref:Uncharacterized protein n=1 Tax=Brucella intermedia M86 TaxID=1234597 RepID=M5JP42_9HYPH|nr:hypothetical protein D584_11247 [Brucella intermedia M86]
MNLPPLQNQYERNSVPLINAQSIVIKLNVITGIWPVTNVRHQRAKMAMGVFHLKFGIKTDWSRTKHLLLLCYFLPMPLLEQTSIFKFTFAHTFCRLGGQL